MKKSSVTIWVVVGVIALLAVWGSGYYTGRVDGVAFTKQDVVVVFDETLQEKVEQLEAECALKNEALMWNDELKAQAYEEGYNDAFESDWMEKRLRDEFDRGTRSVSRESMLVQLELGKVTHSQLDEWDKEGVGYGTIYVTP